MPSPLIARKGPNLFERFQSWAASRREPIQLSFPTADVAELMQQSLGDLLRGVGKMFIETVMEDEVEQHLADPAQQLAKALLHQLGDVGGG